MDVPYSSLGRHKWAAISVARTEPHSPEEPETGLIQRPWESHEGSMFPVCYPSYLFHLLTSTLDSIGSRTQTLHTAIGWEIGDCKPVGIWA